MSEIVICNPALAYIGEVSIRSFDEKNKRADMCRSLYPVVRDANLSMHDWSFARKTAKLNELDETSPEGTVYALPSDCLVPLNLFPRGQFRIPWKMVGSHLIISGSPPSNSSIYLQYTRRETNTALFTSAFKEIVSLDLACRLCIPLAQDFKLVSLLEQKLKTLRMDNEAADANRGDDYRVPDEDPVNDTFVNPMGLSYPPSVDGGWN